MSTKQQRQADKLLTQIERKLANIESMQRVMVWATKRNNAWRKQAEKALTDYTIVYAALCLTERIDGFRGLAKLTRASVLAKELLGYAPPKKPTRRKMPR